MPPRQLIAKQESDRNESLDSIPASKPGKRKAVSSACIPCRRRKSKCDGGKPFCSTCLAVYRTECSYDGDPEAQRKPSPRKDAPSVQLQSRNASLEVVLGSLRSLPENEAIRLLQSLRSQERLDDVAQLLLRSPPNSQRASVSSGPDGALISPTSASSENFRRDSAASQLPNTSSSSSIERPPSDSLSGRSSATSHASRFWLQNPQSAELVDHLLNLYFSWHHPFYTVFSGPHFMNDFRKGRTRYCSPLLLNAVLSLACTFTERHVPYTDPSQPHTNGDAYFAEAQSLVFTNQGATLTTVQALAVMGLREKSCGNERSGFRYIGLSLRSALEMGLHLAVVSDPTLDQLEVEMRKLTFWHVHNLEIIFSIGFGRLSQIPSYAIGIDKPANADQLSSLIWQPYEDVNLPSAPNAQQAMHCLQFTKALSELCQIVNEYNLMLYAPGQIFTLERLQAGYERYKEWYQSVPDALHLHTTGMPQIIALHMFYNVCVLHFFRPFLKFDLQPAGLSAIAICRFCANEISTLAAAYRNVYSFRRAPLILVSAITGSATIHLLSASSETDPVDNLVQVYKDLDALSVNHVHASRCSDTLFALAKRWNIVLPEEINIRPRRPSGPRISTPTMNLFQTHAMIGPDLTMTPLQQSHQQQQQQQQQQPQHQSFQDPLHFEASFWPNAPDQTSSMDQVSFDQQSQQTQQQQQQEQQQPPNLSEQEQQIMWWPTAGSDLGYSMAGSAQGLSELHLHHHQHQHHH